MADQQTLPTLAVIDEAEDASEIAQGEDGETPEVTPESDDATPEVASTGDDETPEVTPESDDATPEATEEVLSIEEQYNITVSYGLEADSAPEAEEAPPEGSRWYVVAGTIANLGGVPIDVGPDELTLIDSEGERYMPLVGDPSLNPSMMGTFAQGESVLGLVRFAIPVEATPAFLEVCLDSECEEIAQREIP